MNENTSTQSNTNIDLATDIVAAYVLNNSVPTANLSNLIASIYTALSSLGQGAPSEAPVVEKLTPARSANPSRRTH